MATILRMLLYGTLATLIGVNLYFFLHNNKDDTPKSTLPKVQSSDSLSTAASPASVLPIVPVPAPAAREILGAIDDSTSVARNAKESFEKGDYKTAADLCKQLAGKNKQAFLCVGLAYFKLADFTNAIAYLEQALENGVDEFTSRKYLAFAYYYRDNFEKSLLNAEKGRGIKKDAELDTFFDRLMKEKRVQGNFVDESTYHFKVQYDGYEHGGISRKVLGLLEDAYSSIGSDLNYYPSEPITVILYTTHDFHDITQAPSWSGGLFDTKDGKIRVPVKGAEGKEALLRTVLFHEYVHALIHSITRSCPLWIHEGLAEYFSKGSSQKIGQVIPLNYLENSFSGLSGRGISVAYTESHSAVSYLMDKYQASRMKDLLFSLSKSSDLNRAFTDSFQISYTEFIEKWGKQ